MNVQITCPIVIAFCKKHPSFSIEKLVSEFITNFNACKPVDTVDIFKEFSVCIQKGIQSKIDDIQKGNYSELKDILTTTGNEVSKRFENVTSQSPLLLQEVLRKLDKVVTSETLRDIPNAAVLSELRGLRTEFEKYTGLFKTGSVKGRNTELKVLMQLDLVFPKHDIISVPSASQKGKMDLVLTSPGMCNISIDTKNYTKTVPKSEVDKFERDILDGNTHGIMVSVSSKISGKPHFTVDVIGGRVGVYLSCTGGDTECIRTAVDIVYAMDRHLKGVGGGSDGGGKVISVGELVSINRCLSESVSRVNRVKGLLETSLEELRGVTLERVLGVLR